MWVSITGASRFSAREPLARAGTSRRIPPRAPASAAPPESRNDPRRVSPDSPYCPPRQRSEKPWELIEKQSSTLPERLLEACDRRQWGSLVPLKEGLGEIHQAHAGQDLVFVSAGRFDQQVTTKLHRDGGPDECFLMLGYEPSAIVSDIEIGDYAKCEFDLGLSASEFLDRHNPMFVAGKELLRPYTTPVDSFSNQSFQILLVNDGLAPYSSEKRVWQGVLHTATIRNPSSSARRVVNSTMIASVPLGTEELLSDDQRLEFLNTTVVRRRGYDQPGLADDP